MDNTKDQMEKKLYINENCDNDEDKVLLKYTIKKSGNNHNNAYNKVLNNMKNLRKYNVLLPSTSLKKIRRLNFRIYLIVFLIFIFISTPYIILSNHTHVVQLVGWKFNTSRNTTEYVLPNVRTTTIDINNVCNDKVLLLIVVCSSVKHFEARQTIRETWGNVTEFNYPFFAKIHSFYSNKYLKPNLTLWKEYQLVDNKINNGKLLPASLSPSSQMNEKQPNFNIKIVYLLGQTNNNETQYKINKESELNNDIIQENFLDTYNNLTLKTVMMLKWVNDNCLENVKFVMKCDDDVFLNIPNLLQLLMGGTIPLYNSTVQFFDRHSIKIKPIKKTNKLLLGTLFCNVRPVTLASNKWYSPAYMYNAATYPNYLSGSGYIMSIDSAQILYNISLNTKIFHLEDVYLTGICALQAKIQPLHSPFFTFTRFSNHCSSKGIITQHQLTPGEIKIIYDFVANFTIQCPSPCNSFNVNQLKRPSKNCT